MAGADSRTVIAVEVFVEQDQIPPVRIALEFFAAAIHRPRLALAGENANEAAGELTAHLLQVHETPGAGGTLHPEVRPEIAVPAVERVDQDQVHGQPDGTAPV